MNEECPGNGICKFQWGDKVAIASKEACSKIHLNAPIRPSQNGSSCFYLIGTVESVIPTGDVKVTFGEDILCTVEPEALVKLPKLSPGALVKLVDDVRGDGNLKLPNGDYYKAATEVCGRICLVLDKCTETADEIDVSFGDECITLSRIHLDFVARPSYGDCRARVTDYACKGGDSEHIVRNLFTALQESMEDLPDVHILASSTSSPRAPGDVIKVSSDVDKFIRWQLKDSNVKPVDPATANFVTLKDYACVGSDGWKRGPFPMEQVRSLLEPGKVVEVNRDGDVIVEFNDGRAWCFGSRFLQAVVDADACTEGTRLRTAKKIQFGIAGIIRHNIGKDHKTDETLHAACYAGNKEYIDLLLHKGVSVHARDANGNTPLHYAVHGNQPEIIKFLLTSGANINATNKRNYTALHFAIKEGFVNCVRVLAKYHPKLNVNIQDDAGNTALHVAIAKMNEEIVKALVNLEEVDFEITNKSGLNALHMAALKGNGTATDIMLSKMDDLVNIRQEDHGYAALHFAAESGHYHLVDKLLSQESCNVDLQNKHEETALVLAAREGHWKIVELLLLAGANINKGDRNGNTALHMSLKKVNERPAKPLDIPASLAVKAVEKTILDRDPTGDGGRLLLPCFLVRSGAKLRCVNKKGTTPLDIAFSLKEPAVELLGFFQFEIWDADSGKCKTCFEAPANTSFQPCGDCFYCEDCGGRMKRCLSCGTFIRERVTIVPSLKSTVRTVEVIQARLTSRGSEGSQKIYKMERKPRGMCIIINNVDFKDNSKRREGSELDASRMESLFTQLHFKVTVETNLSAGDIYLVLSRAAKDEVQKKADCLIVILMSHGGNDTIRGADNKYLSLRKEIYPLFNNVGCPSLKGKPKLFFVQACRGPQRNFATDDASQSLPVQPGSLPRRPEWSDMYFAYATIEDHTAIRSPSNGSWFLDAVYRVFREKAATDDLESMMRDVRSEVMQWYTQDGRMQTPNISIYGFEKKLYFNPDN